MYYVMAEALYPHPLLSFASPSGAGFPFQKKDRNPLNPSIFKG